LLLAVLAGVGFDGWVPRLRVMGRSLTSARSDPEQNAGFSEIVEIPRYASVTFRMPGGEMR